MITPQALLQRPGDLLSRELPATLSKIQRQDAAEMKTPHYWGVFIIYLVRYTEENLECNADMRYCVRQSCSERMNNLLRLFIIDPAQGCFMPFSPPLRTLLASLLLSQGALAAETRYMIHAEPLLVKSEGAPIGKVPGMLTLNQAVTVEPPARAGLCRISTPLTGLVPCSALAPAPASLAGTEQTLKRLVLLYRHPQADGARGSAKGPELIRVILAQLELRFALSPSIHTVFHYAQWLEELRRATPNVITPPSPHPVLERLKAALSQDFGARPPLPPVSATPWLIPHPDAYGLPAVLSRGAPSFFKQQQEVVGWAGGGLVQRMRRQERSGVAYNATFDGASVTTLAPLYEMAKKMRRKVSVRLDAFQDDMGLAQTEVAFGIGSGTVSTDLPVYAVTDTGLVEGRFISMRYDGGACASESHHTGAQFRFAAPLPSTVYALFTSARPVNVARARVSGRTRHWLEFSPQSGHANAFTNSRHFSADLDGDGIPDLRGGDQSQQEAPDAAMQQGAPRLLPVAGWYAHEPLWVMGNIAGQWQELARYDVVTCT